MTTIQKTTFSTLAAVVVCGFFVTAAFAYTAPRNGSQLGAQQDQAQDGAGDGMQRAAGGTTDDAADDTDTTGAGVRDQQQLHVDDPQLGDMDQLQDRERLQDMTDDPDQDRLRTQDQDRVHVD